jgi:2-dehydropantoate 2-reductase
VPPSQPTAPAVPEHNGLVPAGPWQILGAGSIGCLFAAYLQRAGVAVQLLLRDDSSLAAWQHNAAIALQRGDASVDNIAVPALSVTQLHKPLQKILICTKAQQTLAAISSIQDKINANALIILLQNGMGVREQLAELLPQATFLHALTTEGVFQTKRFHLVHAGLGSTVIGVPPSPQQQPQQQSQQQPQQQPQQQDLARAVSAALQCELAIDAVDNIDAHLWLKLVVNSVINPLTALHQCRNGELAQLPNIDVVVAALCAEAGAVANAERQQFETAQLIDTVYAVCRATAANRSSMLQDLTRRRCSEIDFINGYILQRAAQYGIDCPQQRAIFAALKEREHALGCR